MAKCLLPSEIENFKKALKNKELSLADLLNLPTSQLIKKLEPYAGTNARDVAQLIEEKLILKNKIQGLKNAISQLSETGRWDPKRRAEVAEELARYRQEQLDRIHNPKQGEKALETLQENAQIKERESIERIAKKAVGTKELTDEQIAKIVELVEKTKELSEADMSIEENRIAYGRSLLELEDYKNELWKTTPNTRSIMLEILNAPKTLESSLDFSAPFRQGWGMMSRPEFYKAFGTMFKSAWREEDFKNSMAEILARPTYEKMKSSGLRIVKLNGKMSEREEAIMSSVFEKIPGFRGSNRAYTIFLNKVRADVFDKLIAAAELAGEDVSKGSQATKDIAGVINNFTGSGVMGKNDRFAGAVPFLNGLLFSPRKVAATLQIMNPVNYIDPNISPTARKAAARQLFGSLTITATILGLATMFGAETEQDSRSSNFGKLIIGKNHHDFTGGNGTYAVLLARLLSGKYKSSTSGRISDLTKPGFGKQTRLDVTETFLRNKLAPIPSAFANFLAGENTVGEPFEIKKEIYNKFVSLSIQDLVNMIQEDVPINIIFLSMILSSFGAGVSTY